MTAYVALGDSYSAGVGAGDRTDLCFRSELGFPVLLSEVLGIDLHYQACSGATIDDVLTHQLTPLADDTELVTITVGGNDAGFATVLTTSAAPAWLFDSTAALDEAERVIRDELPTRLTGLYAEIARRAPQAEFVVVGYPRLFAGIDCNLATFFTGHEMSRINELADLLVEVTAAAATSTQTPSGTAPVFIDVRGDFDDHEVCQPDSWIHGLTWPVDESFHPKPAGHRAYAEILAEEVALAARLDPTDRATRRVEPGPCIPGSAPPFGLSSLRSAQSRRGAEQAGLDPDEVAQLADRLDRFFTAPDGPHPAAVSVDERDARARLNELDAGVRAREHRTGPPHR